MLIIISDLHISDESTATNVHPTAFDLLCKEISTVVKGKEDIKEIRIVLLGDIFDLVRTDYWLRKNIPMSERPWGGTLDNKTGMNDNADIIEKQFQDILNDVLNTQSAKALIKMLNDVSKNNSNIYTKVTYLIGNHDRVFNNYESLKNKVRTELVDVTKNNTQNDLVEFLNILYTPEYGVQARHGHEWDENCHGWHFLTNVLQPGLEIGRFDRTVYNVMALGEVITAELMGGIVYRASQKIDDPVFIGNLKDANNVRPMTDVFLWLEWFGRNLSSDKKKIILDALKDSIDGVLQSTLAMQWDKLVKEIWIFKGDLTDRLKQLSNYMKNKSFDDIRNTLMVGVDIFTFFEKIFGTEKKDGYVDGAKQEFDGNGVDKSIQYILYGHTHDARNDYFSGNTEGNVKMYINTGTYLPLIERTLNKKDFASSHRMTMVYFYRNDEDMSGRADKGPSLDLWNGLKRKNYS